MHTNLQREYNFAADIIQRYKDGLIPIEGMPAYKDLSPEQKARIDNGPALLKKWAEDYRDKTLAGRASE
jgi:hypothetical protein